MLSSEQLVKIKILMTWSIGMAANWQKEKINISYQAFTVTTKSFEDNEKFNWFFFNSFIYSFNFY